MLNPFKRNTVTMSLTDILLLWYINNKAVGFDIPQYWKYTYNVNDVPQRIKRFLNTEYVTVQTIRNKDKYILTEKGAQLTAQYEHIIYYHRYRNILEPQLTLQTVDTLYNRSREKAVPDFFYEYHMNKVREYWNKKLYGLSRNALLTAGVIKFHDNEYETALEHFFTVLYIDIEGLTNVSAIDTSDLAYKSTYATEPVVAPGVVSYIDICIKNLNYVLPDIEKVYQLAVKPISISKPKYSKAAAKDIIFSEITLNERGK